MNLQAWDVASGRLIVEESGARIDNIRLDCNISVVASTSLIFDELRSLLSSKTP